MRAAVNGCGRWWRPVDCTRWACGRTTQAMSDSVPTQCSRMDSSRPYFVDFTTQTIQDPLSLGGVWSNNTQGAGGNVAPGNLASMRIALASDGSTTIAQHAAAPVVNAYGDSFAFVPNMSSGNLRVTAVVYRNPSYNPSTNHEIEIILAAEAPAALHRWIECLWNSQGGTDIASLDGGPGSYTIIGNSVFAIGPPEDGDIWVVELAFDQYRPVVRQRHAGLHGYPCRHHESGQRCRYRRFHAPGRYASRRPGLSQFPMRSVLSAGLRVVASHKGKWFK